ncbi:UDP-glucosyltransferase 2-like [Wyeomyia smithii]|uniref:UDP-glucosyltransferase 2-like n=1 Tax=Wyeomyia smithii TaxID=174621 RepID=UPI0024680128|nr:UDP-glucosyltransferase 2-like [Wyeomyia smithii]
MWPLRRLISAIVIISVFNNHTEAYRILSIGASPSRSHVIVQEALAKELARRGHHVTMVTPFPTAPSIENYREITVPLSDEGKRLMSHFINDQSRWAMIQSFSAMNKVFMDVANDSINHPEVKRVMVEEKFDLLIITMMADFLLGLTQLLDVPAVTVSPNAMVGFMNDVVGNPKSIATVPSVMLGVSSPMNFASRITNFFGWLLETLFGCLISYNSERYYNSNFPRDRFHPYAEARKNISLILVNQHFTKASPRPYVPVVVEVGGLQVKEKPDPLPEDIQNWIDGAEHGVIFFSLGSNIQSSSMPAEKLEVVLGTLRKLKQRVIWKWDSQDMPNKPPNVLLRSWMPQDDILAQKNVRLFITHGGLGGVAEAQYHGVPLVGIPFFGDQQGNLQKVQKEGWAVVLEYVDLTEQKFSAAIDEVLRNSSYTDTVRRLSKLYRDRPMTAMDTAVFWTEYVIRHKGAPHMRYPGVDLNFFQLYMLDVLAVLGSVVVLLIWVIVRVCNMCCGKKNLKLKQY